MSHSPARRLPLKLGVAAVAAIAMLLPAVAAQAQAPSVHASHSPVASHPGKAGHPGKPGKPAPKPAAIRFNVEGLVTAHTASTVTVLAHNLRVGKTLQHNRSVVVQVAVKTNGRHSRTAAASGGFAAASAIVGDRMSITGTASSTGADATLTAAHVEQHNVEGRAYLGVIKSVSGTTITVSKASPASFGAEGDNGDEALTVDISSATTLVDGAPGALAVGDTVVVLGEGDGDTILAASLYAYTKAPSVVVGEVASVAGGVLAIQGQEDISTKVDLAGATLVVDGQVTTQTDALATASYVLVVGATDAAGNFSPSVAFVLTSHDDHPLPGAGNDGGSDS